MATRLWIVSECSMADAAAIYSMTVPGNPKQCARKQLHKYLYPAPCPRVIAAWPLMLRDATPGEFLIKYGRDQSAAPLLLALLSLLNRTFNYV